MILKKATTSLTQGEIDLHHLIKNHLLQDDETLELVRWYSAIPPDNHRDSEHQAKIERHHQYRRKLEKTGITVRISGFKKRPIKCKHCDRITKHRQEKESDKRCSLEMLEDAFYDRMDRALLISSDSDFVPVLHSLKRYSDVRAIDAIICPPVGREGPAKSLLNTCKKLFSTKPRYTHRNGIRDSLFDESAQ